MTNTFYRLSTLGLMTTLGMCINGCGGGSSATTKTSAGAAIAVTFGGTFAPVAVASQIGTDAWSTATLQAGTLNLTLPHGTTNYGIAYVCGTGAYPLEYVIYASVADGSTYTVSCPSQTTTMGIATGTVDASIIPGAANVEIIGLWGPATGVTGASGSFNASMAAANQDIAFVALNSSNYILAVHIVRNQAVPGSINNGNPIVFLASDALSLQPFMVTNAPVGFLPVPPAFAAGYVTANGTFISLFDSTAGTYPTISLAESQPADYYLFTVSDANLAIAQSSYTSLTTSTAGAVTLSLPAPLAYSAPVPAAFPSFNLSYTGFADDTSISYWAELLWGTPPSSIYTITVTATAAYQNGTPTLAVPNLSGLSGFFPGASSGSQVNWIARVYGGTSQWYVPTPVNGSMSYVGVSNSFVVP